MPLIDENAPLVFLCGMKMSQDVREERAKDANGKTRGRVVLWCRLEQRDLAQAILDGAGLEVVAAGAPSPGGASALADFFAAPRYTDARLAVHEVEHDLLCLMTLQGLEADDMEILLARAPATVTIDPIPAGMADCPMKQRLTRVHLIPLMRSGRLLDLFEEVREPLGAVRSVNVMMRGRAMHGSLYARLTDAVDILEWICGPVELVDAAASGPLAEPPHSLRGLQGHITLNARFASNCCACLHVSDLGAWWFRGVTIMADGGAIRLTDNSFEWHDPDGHLVDSADLDNGSGDELMSSLAAQQIRRVLDPRARRLDQHDVSRTVAVCEAVRLSLRTCQSEAPRKIMEMMGS